jgi:predicted peptidase
MKMKKLFFVLTLVGLGCCVLAQKTVTKEFKTEFVYSQIHGLEEKDGDYILTVIYDNVILKFNTLKDETMSEYAVVKKTDRYVIGKNNNGNYAFFDIKMKQIYLVMYVSDRFITAGFGAEYSEIKQNIIQMMKLLKDGKSQKDAIQHLIKQTEYEY